MFSIENTTAKFDSLNTRIEYHGQEKRPAADIHLTLEMDSSVLDYFHEDLKDLLFREYKNDDEGDLFNGQEEENEGIFDWRFKDLKKIDWSYEGAGYRFVIWSWVEGEEEGNETFEEDVILIMTNINKFKFSPKKNGNIEVSFKVSGHPTPKEIGRLFELQGEAIDITLEPPRL